MQQDCAKQSTNRESKLHCEAHPENELQTLHFREKSQRQSRILCIQCIIESNNKGENLKPFVYLNNFLIDPKNTIMKILDINIDQNQQNLPKDLDEIDKLLLQFEETIKNQLSKIKENIHQMRSQTYQVGEELSNELKLNDVVKQIQLLKQIDSCQGTSELKRFENQLNFISENFNKSYMNLCKKVQGNQCGIAKTLQYNLQIMRNDIETIQKQFMDNLTKLDLLLLEEIQDFPQIHKQISEGKTIEYQLLYQGTRDGLNAQAYWANCNLQQNLLTIMTSKNGNKFGGYSPCQINQQLDNYVQDPTMKSFIFQYNKKELYKLKTKEHAIWCRSDLGPSYGSCCPDIYVINDFQDGGSNLGQSYDISGYHITDTTTHIFGARTSQLQECKVYKVIFK